MVKYNYKEFIKLLEQVFLNHPFISNFYKYRGQLVAVDNIDYPAVVVTPTTVNVGPNVTYATYECLYVDRHTEENDNTDDVNSLGITVITEVINAIRYEFDVDITQNLQFQFFKNQFADRCVGVYTTFQVEMPSDIGECYWICNLEPECC